MTARTLRHLAPIFFCLLALAGCGGQTTVSGNTAVQPVVQPPSTTATPAGNQYSAPQSVLLQSDAGASIYYTTDGSTPSTSSARYTGAITIATSTELKFFAVDAKGNREDVKTERYLLVLPVSLRIATVGVGQSMSGLKVTLTLPAGVSASTSDGSVAPESVAPSGVALASGAILADSLTWDAGTRTLSFILYSTAPVGFGVGEFVNVTCQVSGVVPAPSAFSAVLEPVDLLGNTLAPASASFQVIP